MTIVRVVGGKGKCIAYQKNSLQIQPQLFGATGIKKTESVEIITSNHGAFPQRIIVIIAHMLIARWIVLRFSFFCIVLFVCF